MDMLIIGTSAPGVTGVAEAARLIDLAVAAEGLVVVGTDLATWIDLRVADLYANALGRAFFRALKFKRYIIPYVPFISPRKSRCIGFLFFFRVDEPCKRDQLRSVFLYTGPGAKAAASL